MTATAGELLQAIQPHTTLSDRSLKSALLNIFENGVVVAGPPGRAALKRNAREAAAIAVGLLASPSTLQAGRFANGILGAGRQRGSIADPHGALNQHEIGSLAHVALSRPHFIDALSVLIQEWRVLEEGLSVLSNLPCKAGLDGDWKSTLTMTFSEVPYYSANIELAVSQIQPLNETGFNNPLNFLIMDADWLGKATVNIDNPDRSAMDKIAHAATQEFDHRVVIALGKRLE